MRASLVATALATAALAVGCAATSTTPAAPTGALEVGAHEIAIEPAGLDGLRPVGSVRLTADHAAFGGFSGLLVEDGRLTAVTDQGWLLSAALVGDGAPRLGPARFAPLPGGSGAGGKTGSDAESLARLDGRLAVGFERDQRIEFIAEGRIAATVRDDRFGWNNNGLEALASLPGGALLAIGERARDGAFAVFVVRPDGRVTAGALPQVGRHEVTGADIGPDGRLYLLRRDYALLTGISIRIERYRLAPDGFPRPETREVLAAFENASGIDNMEGIDAWRAPDGGTRLTLISDDNFNWMQRTLLLEFEVTE